MSYDWPNAVAGNQFGLAKLDPEKPLTLKVVTWSGLFTDGGAVAIEGYDADGKKHYSDFGRITISQNRSVVAERKYLEGIVEDFNDDLAANWRALIQDAQAYVLAHYEKEAKASRKKLTEARRGVFA